MIVSLVVAYGRNREIGVKNELPWRLSDDLKNFKKHTLGKPIAMGRKTYESIGRPLPGRENIVLSRNPEYQPEGVTVIRSLEELYQYCEEKGVAELAIIGGDKIFAQVMDRVDTMYITQVEGDFPAADAFFPAFSHEDWIVDEAQELRHERDDRNDYPWVFNVFRRKRN